MKSIKSMKTTALRTISKTIGKIENRNKWAQHSNSGKKFLSTEKYRTLQYCGIQNNPGSYHR